MVLTGTRVMRSRNGWLRCSGVQRSAAGWVSTAAAANEPLAKLPRFLVGDADVVAAEGYRACMNGEAIRVPGALNLAATLAARATPKWLLRRLAGTFGRAAL